MTKTKKFILLFVIFICLFGIMYSADFGKGQSVKKENFDECQLFYVKKEKVNKCIETLKGSNVYESDPYGRKVESMMIIPGI